VPKVVVNNKEVEFEEGMTVLQVASWLVQKYQDFVITKDFP